MARGDGYVYAVYDLKAGLCKIGHTRRPDVRLRTHGVGLRDHIKIMFCVNTGDPLHRRVERLVQEHVANARSPREGHDGGTEWYAVELRHMEWIADLVERFVALLLEQNPDTRYRTVEALTQRARETRGRVIHG